eukprot:4624240-Pleurochrysis_carterae.AAC.1
MQRSNRRKSEAQTDGICDTEPDELVTPIHTELVAPELESNSKQKQSGEAGRRARTCVRVLCC